MGGIEGRMLLVQGSLVSIKWSLLTLSRCTIFFCFFFPFKPPPSSSLPLYATAILLLLLILRFNSYVALCVQKPSTTTTTSSISLFELLSLLCVSSINNWCTKWFVFSIEWLALVSFHVVLFISDTAVCKLYIMHNRMLG